MSAIVSFFKIAVSIVAVLVFFVLLNWAGQGLFTNRGLDEPAYVVAAEEDAAAAPAEEKSFEELLASADPAAGERVFKECKACHRVEEGVNMVGPSLHNVVGRPVGSISDFKYSEAFAGLEGEWTPERIDAFIANPKEYLPGTAMTFAGLKKAADRANVIAYLQSVAN